MVVAARRPPGRGAELDATSRCWGRAPMAKPDPVHAFKRKWKLDSQFAAQRMRALDNPKKNNLPQHGPLMGGLLLPTR
eukprot:3011476-Pyramimonas_sp.AAC.1